MFLSLIDKVCSEIKPPIFETLKDLVGVMVEAAEELVVVVLCSVAGPARLLKTFG